MSSYQFVNSLASCYVGRGTSSGGDLSMSAADYYATAMTNYQNCYGNPPGPNVTAIAAGQQQHYDFGSNLGHQAHPHSLPMSPMSTGGGTDFTIPQALHISQQPMQQQSRQQQLQQTSLQQQQQQQQQQMRPVTQRLNSVASPVNLGNKHSLGIVHNIANNCQSANVSQMTGGASTPSSCKYAGGPEKCLGSPQDLSLTASSMTHHQSSQNSGEPSASATSSSVASLSISNASSRHESMGKSSKSGQSLRNLGPANSSSSKHASNQSQSAAVASSPSSVSSVSSGSQSDAHSPGQNDNGSNSKNSNAPQIYPWMKRVHLGQSKLMFVSTI